MVLEGRIAEAIGMLEIGIEGTKTAGDQKNLTFHGAMLATAYQLTGRVVDGLTLIGTLLEMVERTGTLVGRNVAPARVGQSYPRIPAGYRSMGIGLR